LIRKGVILGIAIILALFFMVGCSGYKLTPEGGFQSSRSANPETKERWEISEGFQPQPLLLPETGQDEAQNNDVQSTSVNYLSNKIVVAGGKNSGGVAAVGYDPNGEELFRHEFPSAISGRSFDAKYEKLVEILNHNIVLIDMYGNKSNLTSQRYGDGFDDKPKELGAFFSPDRSKIIFWASGGLGKPMIDAFNDGKYDKGYWFSMNPDGSEQKLLAENGYLKSPRVSPDGSKIVFDKQLYDNRGRLSGHFSPSTFSKDGRYFAATQTGNWEASIYSADGKRLSTCSFGGSIYDWSPNGDAVAGAMHRIETGTNIYLLPVNNGQIGKPIQLTSTKDRTNTSPVFSPDGSKIAFLSKEGNPIMNYNLELWVMNRDGSEKKKIADIPIGQGGFRDNVTIMEWTGDE